MRLEKKTDGARTPKIPESNLILSGILDANQTLLSELEQQHMDFRKRNRVTTRDFSPLPQGFTPAEAHYFVQLEAEMLGSGNDVSSSEEEVGVDLDGEEDGKQEKALLKPVQRPFRTRRMVLLCIGILYTLFLLGAGHLLGYSPTMTAAKPSRPSDDYPPGGCDAYTETLYEDVVDMTTNACLIIARIVDAMPGQHVPSLILLEEKEDHNNTEGSSLPPLELPSRISTSNEDADGIDEMANNRTAARYSWDEMEEMVQDFALQLDLLSVHPPNRAFIIRALASPLSSGGNSSIPSSSSSSSSISMSPSLLRLHRQAVLFLRREARQRNDEDDGHAANSSKSDCDDAPEICARNPLRTITSAATNAMMSGRLALWDVSRSATSSAAQAANRLLLGLHEMLGDAVRESGVLLRRKADKLQEEENEKEEVARMCPFSSVYGFKRRGSNLDQQAQYDGAESCPTDCNKEEDIWNTRPRMGVPAELVLRRFIRELDYLPELMKIEKGYGLPWHMELFHQELSAIVEAVQTMIDVAELVLEQWTIDFEDKVCSALVPDDNNNGEYGDEGALDMSWCDPNHRNGAKSGFRSRSRPGRPEAIRPPQAILHSLWNWLRGQQHHDNHNHDRKATRTKEDGGTEEAHHLRELARTHFRDAAPPLVLGSRRMQRLATSLSALRNAMGDAVARWRAEVEEIGGRTQRCAEWKYARIAACDNDGSGLWRWRRRDDGDDNKEVVVALDVDVLVVKEILEDGMVTTGATEAVLGEMVRAGGGAENGATVVGWHRKWWEFLRWAADF